MMSFNITIVHLMTGSNGCLSLTIPSSTAVLSSDVTNMTMIDIVSLVGCVLGTSLVISVGVNVLLIACFLYHKRYLCVCVCMYVYVCVHEKCFEILIISISG